MHIPAREPGHGEQACGIDEIPTPALVIDGGIVRRNISRLADYCRTHDLALRPHTKTHKSVFIAGLQLDAGAAGITVAKAGEAEALLPAFAGRGVPDILVAYPPVDPARCRRIAALAREATVRVALDSAFAATGLAAAARAAGSTVGVLVDLDVGMGRTGVADPAALERLAAEVARLPGLRLDGILCYPGHVLAPVAEQAGPLAAVGALLAEAIRRFDRAGLCREIVSGGSTPTAFTSHLIGSLTEIRPGTFVFNDMNTVPGGFCGFDDCAATILCTVVSDSVPGQVVLDGGSKTFTSDRCGPAPDSGHGHVLGFPEAVVAKLTEEHGQVDVRACSAPPRVGDRVRVIPNHICPCVNLQDHVWWLEDGVARPLPVDARGRLS